MPADLVIFPPHATARRDPARHLHPAALPHWRALLETRWQEHQAKASEYGGSCRAARCDAGQAESARGREASLWRESVMWHRAVAQWRALAEIEAALSRLAAGRFGWCQDCGAAIAAPVLAQIPQTRYCPACDQ